RSEVKRLIVIGIHKTKAAVTGTDTPAEARNTVVNLFFQRLKLSKGVLIEHPQKPWAKGKVRKCTGRAAAGLPPQHFSVVDHRSGQERIFLRQVVENSGILQWLVILLSHFDGPIWITINTDY